MANLAEQLITALTSSGAPRMCITTPGSNVNGNYQPPMQLTIELQNADGSHFSLTPQGEAGQKRALDSPEETGGKGSKRAKKGAAKPKRNKTKVVDMAATLAKYLERIGALPDEDFKEFEGAYLTDYKLHGSSPNDSPATTHVFALGKLAEERGAKPRGYVSANKKEGKFVEALSEGQLRPEEGGDAKLVYVGEKNQFTNQAVSKWALLREDKVFVAPAAASEKITE